MRVAGADGLINELMETETATENYYGENQWLRVYFVDLSGKKNQVHGTFAGNVQEQTEHGFRILDCRIRKP